MMGSWVSAATEQPKHFLCVGCWFWSHKVDLEEHPSRIYLEALIHFGGEGLFHGMNTELKTGCHWLPDKFTVLFTLWLFKRQGHWCFFHIIKMDYGSKLHQNGNSYSAVSSLCLVCIRGSDVVGSGQGSAKQGEMEKKAKLNRRDRQPLHLLLLLHFRSHVHICFPGLQAEGRSILNLVPHPAVFPNLFWLSVYYSNSAVLLL